MNDNKLVDKSEKVRSMWKGGQNLIALEQTPNVNVNKYTALQTQMPTSAKVTMVNQF